MTTTRQSFAMTFAGTALFFASEVFAAGVNFQDPGSAAWGNWNRGDNGTVYVHWDQFVAAGNASLPFDTSPDQGRIGVKNNNGAILFTKEHDSDASPAAFVTGSGNIYSFADVLAFDVTLQPRAAHEGVIGNNPVLVALQVSVLGTDIDDDSVRLFSSLPYTSKQVLKTGGANGPEGQGGIANEYLYLFEFPIALSIYTISFAAEDTSFSLDAISIDIGPAPDVIDPPPLETPLPASAWLFGVGATLLGARTRRRRR